MSKDEKNKEAALEKKSGLPAEVIDKIHERLTSIAQQGCPRCGHEEFELVDGLAFVPMSRTPGVIEPGSGMPCACAFCTRCGYVTFHSMVVLGLSDVVFPEQAKRQ